MGKPTEVVWEMEEHTHAKHRILRRYLDAWLPIMSKYNRRLVYVDGFAGPGVYLSGEPGSPIIALQALLEHGQRQAIDAEVVYLFIEEHPLRAERLHAEVASLGELPGNVALQIVEGVFQEEFGSALDEIEEHGRRLAPTFAFIDPFGYSQAPMELSGRFLQFGRCEVLIYVPLPFVNRFVGRDGQEEALTSLYGCDEWKHALHLEGPERQRFLHDLFRDQLHNACGLPYVRSFEIVGSRANTGYHLFFGTGHELGLLKMKEAMWKLDPIAGERFRDTTSAGQQPLFEREADTSPLRDLLIGQFGREPFTIEQAERFTLIDTPYVPTMHLKRRTLKPLEDDGGLKVVSSSRKRANGYPPRTVLRFTS